MTRFSLSSRQTSSCFMPPLLRLSASIFKFLYCISVAIGSYGKIRSELSALPVRPDFGVVCGILLRRSHCSNT